LEARYHSEREDSEAKFDNLLSAKQTAESELSNLKVAKSRMEEEIHRLEANLDQKTKNATRKEKQLLSIIESMEAKEQELSDQCYVHERSLDELRTKLDQSQFDANHSSLTWEKQVKELDNILSEQKRTIGQKEAELQGLKNLLEMARTSQQESEEVDQLRGTLLEMRGKIKADQFRIDELESTSIQRQEEIDRVREELSTANEMVQNFESEIQALQDADTLSKNLQMSLQGDLAIKSQQLTEAEQEIANLRGTVGFLEQEVEDAFDHQYEQATQEPSGESAAEIESLRQQIESLKSAQQTVSSSRDHEKEDMLSTQVKELQQDVQQRDSQIFSLKREVCSLSQDLSLSQQKIKDKKSDLQKLFSENQDLRTQSAQQPTVGALLSSTEEEEAESEGTMRSQLIALAQALEKSESSRADAIEKLEKERKDNAASLKRVTASVKRFYATLKYGD